MGTTASAAETATWVTGRLVMDDGVRNGRILIKDGRIAGVETDDSAATDGAPYICPGFADVHVHGWGGHDAMGGPAALSGMARALLRHGVTSFLPSAYTSPVAVLSSFASEVRAWMPDAPADGAEPLGFNLEGPFLSNVKRGMHDPGFLVHPTAISAEDLEPLIGGLRLITIAPEMPGALELTMRLRERGVVISLGHSDADVEVARSGYAAGATSTTHLFNAMSGIDHRRPGLAVAALLDDDVYVELIADGQHVHPAIWPLISRVKPADHLVLVSDALPPAGTGQRRARLGRQAIEIDGPRVTIAGTSMLAGSVIALDSAVRNLVREGISLHRAVAAASRNPLAMLGVTDRGRIAIGHRAHLVALDDRLRVLRVFRDYRWLEGADQE